MPNSPNQVHMFLNYFEVPKLYIVFNIVVSIEDGKKKRLFLVRPKRSGHYVLRRGMEIVGYASGNCPHNVIFFT